MTSKRDIRAKRRAEQKRDHSWMEERDEATKRENAPDDEHISSDELSQLAKDFRQ